MSCEGELILLCKLECYVVFWLELCTDLALGLLYTEQPTSGNMWKVIEMIFLYVCCLCNLQLEMEDYYPCCQGQSFTPE